MQSRHPFKSQACIWGFDKVWFFFFFFFYHMPGTMLSFVLSIWDILSEKTLSFLTRKSDGSDLEFPFLKLDSAIWVTWRRWLKMQILHLRPGDADVLRLWWSLGVWMPMVLEITNWPSLEFFPSQRLSGFRVIWLESLVSFWKYFFLDILPPRKHCSI